MTADRRPIAMLFLFMALFGLLIWYGSLSPSIAASDPPGGTQLADDYDSYIGERIEIYGRVISTNPVVISGEYGERHLELTITGVERKVRSGQYLHVYARVLPGMKLRALGTVVYPENGILFTYGASGLALVWVTIRFFNVWRFDLEDLAFERRNEPLTDRIIGVSK